MRLRLKRSVRLQGLIARFIVRLFIDRRSYFHIVRWYVNKRDMMGKPFILSSFRFSLYLMHTMSLET